MPATMAELGLDKWSVADRRKLLHELYASIDRDEVEGEEEVAFEEWEIQMINERLDEIDHNPQAMIPWDEARARIRGSR